jgi:hypothetical protein
MGLKYRGTVTMLPAARVLQVEASFLSPQQNAERRFRQNPLVTVVRCSTHLQVISDGIQAIQDGLYGPR